MTRQIHSTFVVVRLQPQPRLYCWTPQAGDERVLLAAREGHLRTVKALLHEGTDVNPGADKVHMLA
jgi:hypothetical protein